MSESVALEYVLGTLSPQERATFEKELADDLQLQQQVRFWEEHLMGLQDKNADLPPRADTWSKIAAQVQTNLGQPTNIVRPARWHQRHTWWLSAAAVLLVVIALGVLPRFYKPAPNVDYVAVLTGDAGAPLLTALTAGASKTLWLQWEDVTLPAHTSLQLWAISKRDGQVRSLGVFDTQIERTALGQAEWRLIQDAQELLLTLEEAGGSAINEPSTTLLARGVCVRLRHGEAG